MDISAITLAFLLLASSFSPKTITSVRPDEGRILSFADWLFDSGDYYRAITEYERFLFNFPRSADAGRARLRIGMSYERGGKWTQAEDEFQEIVKDSPGTPYALQASWELGETLYKSGQYPRAAGQYSKFRETFPGNSLVGKAQIRTAWCSVKTGRYDDAQNILSRVDKESPSFPLAQSFSKDLNGFRDLGRKSPALAGVLSAVVPGTGQFYTGRFMDGAAALLLNAAFIFAAVEAYNYKLYGTFGILIFFETGWYGGNIYSAVSSAHKYTRSREDAFIRDLERKYWEP